MEQHILGIDMIEIDSRGTYYGIYESFNGGEQWEVVLKSLQIYELIMFAKIKYSKDIRVIMPAQIHELLKMEMIMEYQEEKRKALTTPSPTHTWFYRLVNFFKKA